jgi:hypothetical protein
VILEFMHDLILYHNMNFVQFALLHLESTVRRSAGPPANILRQRKGAAESQGGAAGGGHDRPCQSEPGSSFGAVHLFPGSAALRLRLDARLPPSLVRVTPCNRDLNGCPLRVPGVTSKWTRSAHRSARVQSPSGEGVVVVVAAAAAAVVVGYDGQEREGGREGGRAG